MGRVSFAKGIDHVAHFLNVISPHVPIDEVKMIGKIEGTTFRTYSARDYFLNRLTPNLRSRVNFAGIIDRKAMRDAVNPHGIGGYSLSFSDQETFNYAFLEMLEAGLFPFTHHGTAMAEFFPATHQRFLIPEDFNLSSAVSLVQETKSFGSELLEEISDHAFQISDPSLFVSSYERIVSSIAAPQSRTSRGYSSKDVTVLMATRNPSESIVDSINAVTNQSQAPRLIILSDGSDLTQSEATLSALEREDDTTILRSKANEGLCASRQKLIEVCTTKLAIFLDDDDILDTDYVAKTLRAFNHNQIEADAVLTWRQNFGLSSELIFNYNLEDYESLITNDYRMTALVRLDVLKALGFTPSMRNGEADDWDFWLRFFQNGHRAVFVPEPLFQYNVRDGSMSWPWAKGQTALTSELLARRASKMLHEGKLPEAYLLDLYSQISQENTDSSSAKDEMRKLARRRPFAGNIAYFMYRMSRSIQKRSQ
jgi:glycosyltransferase involved in cell wall biosynthesis